MYYIIFLFFFKQKTAYEMRISDWSSDVCSSDLHAGSVRRWRIVNNAMSIGPPSRPSTNWEAHSKASPASGAATAGGLPTTSNSATNGADRKSLGSGKSVAVRVGLGGRSNMKKKNV